jgi:hypothetical protein
MPRLLLLVNAFAVVFSLIWLVGHSSLAGSEPICDPAVGCECRHFPVEGTVVFVAGDGAERPLAGVRFYTADRERDRRKKVWAVTTDSGAFRFDATVRPDDETWCEEGARLVFLMRAKKCDDRTIQVTPGWRPRTIEMTCPGRR